MKDLIKKYLITLGFKTTNSLDIFIDQIISNELSKTELLELLTETEADKIYSIIIEESTKQKNSMMGFVNNLTNDQMKQLMLALIESNKVIIPQYFLKDNFDEELTSDQINDAQKMFSLDDELLDNINDKLLNHISQKKIKKIKPSKALLYGESFFKEF